MDWLPEMPDLTKKERISLVECDWYIDLSSQREKSPEYLMDRIKDIVIRGGENIACLEIEAVLAEHPSISEASVFGVPDERLGESLATRIALKPGQTVTEAEVSSFLEEKIAKFKIPSHMWIQEEELPRIASGKTAKKQMREEAIKELGLE